MDYQEYLREYGGAEHFPKGVPGGFFIYEAGGDEKILFADENILRLYGCSTFQEFVEFVGGSFKGMVYPGDLEKIQNEIQAQTLFGEKRHDYVKYRIRNKQGEIRYVEDFGHLLHGVGYKSYFYVFIVDVDRNEFLNKSLSSLAEVQARSLDQGTDELTGLFNMTFFFQKVQSMIASPEGRRIPLSIIHFDIPNFKLFNERQGFRLGDELLCELARTIRSEFTSDTIARFSDDHFVVCAEGQGDDIVNKVGTVYKKMLGLSDPNMRVRIKAGIYYMDDRCSEVGLACDHARLACNSIKGRHDMYYFIYDEMLRERLRRQQYVIDHIDEALSKRYITVYYQPVIRVQTGQLCGFEALVRWVDPEMGRLFPSDFISTLEQYHLIHMLDRYVVQEVCRDYRRLVDEGKPVVPVSVNLSRLDFELCDVYDMVEKARAEFDVPSEMLELEVTESALNDDASTLKTELTRLKDAGYHIWLDDFGSGYSSLNILTEYSFNVIKLDLVFLRSYDHNPKTGALLGYIVKGVGGMGLESLCEGVETEEHFNFLYSINCDRAQGYFFSKPLPLDEVTKLLQDRGIEWEKK
ncbi:MAG: GGDEF and EAL domain-containing protein [Lachnospiraceae bacterium]|nr:GGDEF and EAL domain-containing protein [Lachnospiraceae bacterium]